MYVLFSGDGNRIPDFVGAFWVAGMRLKMALLIAKTRRSCPLFLLLHPWPFASIGTPELQDDIREREYTCVERTVVWVGHLGR